MIEVARFSVDIGKAGAHLSNISNKTGIVGKQVADGVCSVPRRGVKACLID